jgi:hypothetical protein
VSADEKNPSEWRPVHSRGEAWQFGRKPYDGPLAYCWKAANNAWWCAWSAAHGNLMGFTSLRGAAYWALNGELLGKEL